MTIAAAAAPVRAGRDRMVDYPFTDADFAGVAALAREAFGLHLEAHKRDLVYGRLCKRLRLLGLETFAEYLDVLRGPVGDDERREMLCALTTNVTQFFREAHHFDLLRDAILPDLLARARRGERVRLWSAGCSGGQEAFSIALTVASACPDAARLDLRILATDVDPVILKRGMAARYPAAERAAIPAPLCRAGVVDGADGTFAIAPDVRRLVTFGELNLMQRWPMRGPFDVIFCRNVAIYFDRTTQERLWGRFADLLRDGGRLMVGHSERVTGPAADRLRSDGVTAYTRREAEIGTAPDQR